MAATLSSRRTARVLVVDDNEDTSLALATLLRQEGHDVRQAHDGIVAFTLAEQFKPDIAVLDLAMPRRGGLELAQMIKATEWGTHIVLIALTGHDDLATRRKATAAGFDVFLSKPLDPFTFEELIQKLLLDAPPVDMQS